MTRLLTLADSTVERLEGIGAWLAPLGLRLLLAWEFWEAGREKLAGSNWFADLQGGFPFPFDLLPASLSWSLATWTELLGALALLLGLGTRIAAFALLVLTIVATAAVHWPDSWNTLGELAQGYAITDRGHGNFKLPLLFVVMLLPLVLRGPGKLSLDALIARLSGRGTVAAQSDLLGWGGALVAFGLPLAMLLPLAGLVLATAGLLLAVAGSWLRH